MSDFSLRIQISFATVSENMYFLDRKFGIRVVCDTGQLGIRIMITDIPLSDDAGAFSLFILTGFRMLLL